jgi:hypothetical protein
MAHRVSGGLHSVVSGANPSKRKNEPRGEEWEESRSEARDEEPATEAPFEAVFEAIEAAEAVFEAIEAAEAVIEGPRPWAEGAAEDPVVEARGHPAVEARVAPVRNSPSPALGMSLVGSPQHHHKREGSNAKGQKPWKHDLPPFVKPGSRPRESDDPRAISIALGSLGGRDPRVVYQRRLGALSAVIHGTARNPG